jgi:hypothetical protein
MVDLLPHPSLSLSLTAAEPALAYDALMKGLDDLADHCDVILSKFENARDQFENQMS